MCLGSSTACADGSTIYSAAVPYGRRHCPFQTQTRSPMRLATSGPTLSISPAPSPVVLAGDYNVVPTDRDIYAVRSYADDALLQAAPRAQLQKLLRQGWRDALRALHPDAALYTYWSYLRNRWPRDAGLRIDHLLLSALAAK